MKGGHDVGKGARASFRQAPSNPLTDTTPISVRSSSAPQGNARTNPLLTHLLSGAQNPRDLGDPTLTCISNVFTLALGKQALFDIVCALDPSSYKFFIINTVRGIQLQVWCKLTRKYLKERVLLDVLFTNFGCQGARATYARQLGNAVVYDFKGPLGENKAKDKLRFEQVRHILDSANWVDGMYHHPGLPVKVCMGWTLVVKLAVWPRQVTPQLMAAVSQHLTQQEVEAVLASLSFCMAIAVLLEVLQINVQEPLPPSVHHLHPATQAPPLLDALRTLGFMLGFEGAYYKRMVPPSGSVEGVLRDRLGVVPAIVGCRVEPRCGKCLAAAFEHLTNPEHLGGLPIPLRLVVALAYALTNRTAYLAGLLAYALHAKHGVQPRTLNQIISTAQQELDALTSTSLVSTSAQG